MTSTETPHTPPTSFGMVIEPSQYGPRGSLYGPEKSAGGNLILRAGREIVPGRGAFEQVAHIVITPEEVPGLLDAIIALGFSPTETFTMATPFPGSVRDQWGDVCKAATADSYPLTARCQHCTAGISAADGPAEWGHIRTGQGRCQ